LIGTAVAHPNDVYKAIVLTMGRTENGAAVLMQSPPDTTEVLQETSGQMQGTEIVESAHPACPLASK
jgi:hypothetical protein